MSSHKSMKTVIKWLLAAATVLVAGLLIWQCADIFRVGMSAANQGADGVRISDIYSREIVAERFGRISWSVWIWLVLFVISLFLHSKETSQQKKNATVMQPKDQLALLLERREKTPEMLQFEKKRRTLVGIATVVCVVCAIGAIAYLVAPSSFASRDLEPVMGQMMFHVVPWVVVAFAVVLVIQNMCMKNVEAELALAKKAPAKEKEAQAQGTTTASENQKKKQNIARIAVLIVAILFIIAGITNGGMFDVFVKAINICTECIGLG